ncbi:MAG: DUF1573 domain-containing protein [Chitinophagales bacterium]
MNKFILPLLAAFGFMLASCGDETPATEETVETTIEETTSTIEEVSNTAEEILPTETIAPTEVMMTMTSMSIDRMEHDFGNIPDTDPVETTFTITNTGNDPLLISGAQGSCGCTVPEYPKEPIPAGESREMQVSFSPSGKEGAQNKTVTISANIEGQTQIINIKSNVQKTAQ